MRIKQKYKIFSKSYFPLINVPSQKILTFHRSKWKKVQRLLFKEDLILLKKKKKLKIKFKDHSKPFSLTKRWTRCRFAFRSYLVLKKKIQLLFLRVFTRKDLKKLYLKQKNKNYLTSVQNFLIKPEYRLDILLVRLNFFFNPYLAKNYILNSNLLVNNKKLSFSYFCKKGDIIQVPSLITLKKINSNPSIFLTFLEIDYYTNTIVIIKDVTELTKKDFFLLTRYLYNLFDLKDSLFK